MVSTLTTCVAQLSFNSLHGRLPRFTLPKSLTNQIPNATIHHRSNPPLKFSNFAKLAPVHRRRESSVCFFNAGNDSNKQEEEPKLDWPILKRWEVPWEWQTVSLTSLACGLSFVLTGLVASAAVPYLGLRIEELTLDDKALILFVDQGITTAVVLAVIFSVANTFQPLPEDIFRYDLKEPFNLQKGWLLWAGIGLAGGVAAIALTGAVMSLFRGENPEREHCLLGWYHRCLCAITRGDCISRVFYGVTD